MPQLPTSWNNSAAQASLAPVASSPEYYIPLWWYSGGVTTTAPGQNNYIAKGSNTGGTTATGSQNKLHTLSPNWSANTNFAFEAAMYATNPSNSTAQLYDITASYLVSGSQITATTGNTTVVRSGKFTLTPGHAYGVMIYNGSYQMYLTDASLIVFPQ
jgi:hypothetical protein